MSSGVHSNTLIDENTSICSRCQALDDFQGMRGAADRWNMQPTAAIEASIGEGLLKESMSDSYTKIEESLNRVTHGMSDARWSARAAV